MYQIIFKIVDLYTGKNAIGILIVAAEVGKSKLSCMHYDYKLQKTKKAIVA